MKLTIVDKWGHDKWSQSKIKSLSILSSTYSLSVVTIFKPVILAWMPESSARDGNCMIINNIIFHAASHPCDWIPASMLTAIKLRIL